jgi:hypothetical protein
MKYLKKIDLKDINITKKEIKNSYQKGKNYYKEVEEKQKENN